MKFFENKNQLGRGENKSDSASAKERKIRVMFITGLIITVVCLAILIAFDAL